MRATESTRRQKWIYSLLAELLPLDSWHPLQRPWRNLWRLPRVLWAEGRNYIWLSSASEWSVGFPILAVWEREPDEITKIVASYGPCSILTLLVRVISAYDSSLAQLACGVPLLGTGVDLYVFTALVLHAQGEE
jgi:hypothetical protein